MPAIVLVGPIAIIGVALLLSWLVVRQWRLTGERRRAWQVARALVLGRETTHDLEVTCRLVTRDGRPVTEIVVQSNVPECLPTIEIERAGPPGTLRLVMAAERVLEHVASVDIRPRTAAERRKPLDPERDFRSGDRMFDEAYVVEIAPRAVAPALLDAATRRQLLALHPARLRQRAGGLVLEKRGFVVQRGELESTVALVACLTARVTQILTRMESGTSYRGQGRVAAEARRAEVASLLVARGQRAQRGADP